MMFELVYEYGVSGGSGRLRNTRIREHATVYPYSGQFGPYVHHLMILILKSTQNLRGYHRV